MGYNGSYVRILEGLQATEELSSIVPFWFLKGYIWTVIVGGVAGNLLLICTIIRCSPRWRKDQHYCDVMVLLLHLAVTDIAAVTLVAPFEVWVLRSDQGLWDVAEGYCPVFMGLEEMLSLAGVYLLLALSLHAVTARRSPPDGEPERGSCVRVPLSLVWLIAVSLSVPEFSLAQTVMPRPDYRLCTVLDSNDERRAVLHTLHAIFRVGVPVVVLLVTCTTTVLKLSVAAPREATSTAKRHVLRISLVLSVSYAVFSLPRSVFFALHAILPRSEADGPDAFREPPLASVATSPSVTLALSMMHFLLSGLRPFLCFVGHRHVCTCCCEARRSRPR